LSGIIFTIGGSGSLLVLRRLSLRQAQALFPIFRRFTLHRKVSLSITLLFVTSLAALQFGCSSPEPGEGDMNTTLSFDINSPKIKERLGNDDGYAMAIIYGADIHGSLETCG
jgi:hypothetical protein